MISPLSKQDSTYISIHVLLRTCLKELVLVHPLNNEVNPKWGEQKKEKKKKRVPWAWIQS